jgi:hypothetical protein
MGFHTFLLSSKEKSRNGYTELKVHIYNYLLKNFLFE